MMSMSVNLQAQDLEIYDLMLQNEGEDADSDTDSDDLSSRQPSSLQLPMDPMMSMSVNLQAQDDPGTGSDSSLGRREKARQRNLNKEDLLFNDTDMPNNDHLVLPPKSLML